MVDIEKVISAQEQAVDLIPEGHAGRPTYLSNLGVSFMHCFNHTGEMADIGKAISVQEQAVDLNVV